MKTKNILRNRLLVTAVFFIIALVGECAISFFYGDIPMSFNGCQIYQIKIRQTLISKYGWEWYFKNMVASPINYYVGFSNLRPSTETYGNKDTYCGLWIIVLDDSGDQSKADYIKEGIDIMAENNDSIIYSFPLDGVFPYLDYKKLKNDREYCDDIFLKYLACDVNDLLYRAFYMGKYTKCYVPRSSFTKLVCELMGNILSYRIFPDYDETVRADYISECQKLNIRPLLKREDYADANDEEIGLLGKYVMIFDNEKLKAMISTIKNLYPVDFIYKPEKNTPPVTIFSNEEL